MNILITGGHGFLGHRLARALVDKGALQQNGGPPELIQQIVLADINSYSENKLADKRVTSVQGDITVPRTVKRLFDIDFDVIFHLASLVSGGAEINFELGTASNLYSTYLVLEQCRRSVTKPTFVFTSSVAVYGGDLPEVSTDVTALTPQTTYGTHKAICELLIHDYTRKGFVDGRSIRLPIVIVRPGTPNSEVASFASSIVREPLNGEICNCAMHPDDELYVASVRDSIQAIIHAAESPSQAWGSFRAAIVPGLTTSPRAIVEGLCDYAGNDFAELIKWTNDRFVRKIVRSWPSRFESTKAKRIGFADASSIQTIIKEFACDAPNGGRSFSRSEQR